MEVSVNFTKFSQAPSSPFTPTLSRTWRDALESLKTLACQPSDFHHANADLLRGYPVPDPFLFTRDGKPEDEMAAVQNMVSWLYVRFKWTSCITGPQSSGEPVKIPGPQHWRNFLYLVARARNLADGAEEAGPTGTGNKRAKTTMDQTKRIFADFIPPSGPSLAVHWNGKLVLSAEKIQKSFIFPALVGAQIIWELFENNFRLELLALDRCVRPRAGNVAEQWDEEVRRIFPRSAWMVLTVPTWDEGLGAAQAADRVAYVERFRKLLASWPEGTALQELSAQVDEGSSDVYKETAVLRVEAVAYPFYCRTFFKYFSRAPSVPYQLPL